MVKYKKLPRELLPIIPIRTKPNKCEVKDGTKKDPKEKAHKEYHNRE
jgi:hypothetical protein